MKLTKELFKQMLLALESAKYRLERLDDAGTGEHSPAYLEVVAAIEAAEKALN
jgi:hypothetical protein